MATRPKEKFSKGGEGGGRESSLKEMQKKTKNRLPQNVREKGTNYRGVLAAVTGGGNGRHNAGRQRMKVKKEE